MMDEGQAELDYAAQQLGFPDYATWAAWRRNQQVGATRQVPAQQQMQAPPQEENFLQYLFRRIPPFSLIGDSAQRYQKVAPKGTPK